MSLTEPLVDDLENIGIDEGYTLPERKFGLVPKGRNTVRIDRWEEATDRRTGALFSPYTLNVNFVITEGPNENRRLMFSEIKDQKFTSRPGASLLNDFIAVVAKAVGHEGPIKGREAIARLLDQARDTNATFKVRHDYQSYDSAYIRNIKDRGETPTNDDYNTARIRGIEKFNEDGEVEGPSGNVLKARVDIKGF